MALQDLLITVFVYGAGVCMGLAIFAITRNYLRNHALEALQTHVHIMSNGDDVTRVASFIEELRNEVSSREVPHAERRKHV